MKSLLLGDDGSLRYLWHAILFIVVGTRVVHPLLALGFPLVAKAPQFGGAGTRSPRRLDGRDAATYNPALAGPTPVQP
jgi:hypothetical protein